MFDDPKLYCQIAQFDKGIAEAFKVFETWSVAATYAFKSNARTVLGETARFAMDATSALEKLTAAMGEADDATAAFSRGSRAAMGQVSAGFGSMSAEATGAADRVVTANQAMSGSFTSLSRSANAASASVERFRAVSASGIGGAAGRTGVAGGRVAGIAGGVGTAASLGALATIAIGTRQGASLRESEAQMGVAMGRSTDDIDRRFGAVAGRMSGQTAQSIANSMSILSVIATAGFNDPRKLLANNAALPMAIAQFADVQYLGRHHVPFEESAGQAATLAHQLGTRTAASLVPMLNTLSKISFDMPDSLSTAATQIKYYGGQYQAAGVTPSEILQLQATADRLGLGGGRSGTGFRALLSSMQSPSSEKMFAAQRSLGLFGTNGRNRFIDSRTGAFNVEGLFDYLNRQSDSARRTGTVAAFNQTMQRISTSGAAPVLSLFTSDAGREQRRAVSATLRRVPDLQFQQTQLMDNLNKQTQRLATNFSTLATTIAGPLQKPLTALVSGGANALSGANDFLVSHPGQAAFATAAISAGAVLGTYKLFKLIGGFGAFVHAAAHSAGEGVGLRAWFPIARHGAEAAGRGGGLLGGLARMVPGVGFMGRVKAIGTLFEEFGMRAASSGVGVRLVTETLAKLGLRAIPVVGEVLLAVDAIKLLSTHAGDIGWVIGKSARWIAGSGAPMLGNALREMVVHGISGAFMSIANAPAMFEGGLESIVTSAFQVAHGDVHNSGKHGRPLRNGGGFDSLGSHRTQIVDHGKKYAYVPGSSSAGGTHLHGDINVAYSGNDIEELLQSARRHVVRGDVPDRSPSSPANASNVTPGVHLSGTG